MFKLVTGSPGDGKTSNELWEFLHADQYKGRPKYCTPVNGFEPEKHGVTPIEHIKIWQDLPDGSVIFCDEVQDYLGARSGRDVPDWIQQLARHRHRGFDFIVTTQSPLFLDQFVRKLAKPHVHYIRPWNMKGKRYRWDTVQNDPTTKTAKKAGQGELVTPNPEVFKLYTSTVLDTHKAAPPWKILAVGVVALLLLIGGVSLAGYNLSHMNEAPVEPEPPSPSSKSHSSSFASTGAVVPASEGWTTESIKPRIEGLAWTAPVYDRLTAPSDFPRVSACMYAKSTGCKCYSQQATPVDAPEVACLVFVKTGSFDPWLSARSGRSPTGDSGATAGNAKQQPGTIATTGAGDVVRHEQRATPVVVVNSGKPGHLW